METKQTPDLKKSKLNPKTKTIKKKTNESDTAKLTSKSVKVNQIKKVRIKKNLKKETLKKAQKPETETDKVVSIVHLEEEPKEPVVTEGNKYVMKSLFLETDFESFYSHGDGCLIGTQFFGKIILLLLLC